MGQPAGRGGAFQRPRGEDHHRRVRLPRAPAGSHRAALGARRAVSGHAQRRQPARIRPLAGTRQEPLRAQPHPHGAPQGVPLADPYPDPDVRADRPGPGRARHLDPGHVALQEFHRGSDHRPQDRPPEQYPSLRRRSRQAHQRAQVDRPGHRQTRKARVPQHRQRRTGGDTRRSGQPQVADRPGDLQLPEDDPLPGGDRADARARFGQHLQQCPVVGRRAVQGARRHRQRPVEGEAPDPLCDQQQPQGDTRIVQQPEEDRPARPVQEPDRNAPPAGQRGRTRAALPRPQQHHVAPGQQRRYLLRTTRRPSR